MMENIDKHGDLIKQAEKKELMKVFTNNVLTEFRIINWLQRFRQRYEIKKKTILDKEAARLQRQTLGIDEERKIELEEEVSSLRGILEFSIEDFRGQEQFDKLRSKIAKQSYDQFVFSFLDEILVWKKKSNSNKAEGKVYFQNVEDIKVEGTLYICFVRVWLTLAD